MQHDANVMSSSAAATEYPAIFEYDSIEGSVMECNKGKHSGKLDKTVALLRITQTSRMANHTRRRNQNPKACKCMKQTVSRTRLEH